MRLLCLRNGVFQIKEFHGDIPRYAILSHTWGADDDEVTFTDITTSTAGSGHKPGFKKLAFCARKASEFDIEYFWVDTCCIDKSSSTELSEAINSMFRWYRDAAYCFVYLSDISYVEGMFGLAKELYRDDAQPRDLAWRPITENPFRNSRWCTRGWTLQELLAPRSSEQVRFYISNELYIGDRTINSDLIMAATAIPKEVLVGGRFDQYSVSDRLKWAEKRTTKREEDGAYSLLGIFDVHMPLIYGEGREKAMSRLLLEIQANELRVLNNHRAAYSDRVSIYPIMRLA